MHINKILVIVMLSVVILSGCSRNYNYTKDKNLAAADNYYYKQGMDALVRKNAVEAVPNFSEVIRINPKSADAFYQRSRIYQAAGFEKLWKEDFDSARTLSAKYRALETPKPLEFKLSESEIEILKPVAVPEDAAIIAEKPSPIDN